MPGFLGGVKQRGGFGAEFRVGRIQRIEQQQITEMKNTGFVFFEIQVRAVPQGIGAAMMKKSAMAAGLFRHDIGVGSGGQRGGAQMPGVDAMTAAILQNGPAQIIIADQTGAAERERGAASGQD